MRHAARVDSTQSAIVAALRAAGARVWIIGLPVDLLVGVTGAKGQIFAFFECKTPVGKRNPKPSATTALQDRFMSEFDGWPVCLVDSPECALRHYRTLAGLA